MSHPEQVGFFQAVARANPGLVDGGAVLEIGSYDVNGTIRPIFGTAGRYLGVDLTEGPGVDHVGFGHELDAPAGSFDLAISGECFEHDPHWAETFATMTRVVRPGGLVAFTCASRGRPEHGTSRSDVLLSPGTQAVGLDYYRNLTEADFADLPLSEWFSTHRFWFSPAHCDLFFAGVRRGEGSTAGAVAHLPADDAVERLADLMSTPHRLARLPLKALARTSISEERFHDLTYRYWKTLARLVGDRAAR